MSYDIFEQNDYFDIDVVNKKLIVSNYYEQDKIHFIQIEMR